MAAETDEQRLDDVIAAYFQQVESGHPTSPDEWISKNPELRNDLIEFFADRQGMERLALPLRTIAGRCPITDVPDTLGDFLIGEEIGRGGMGVVYEAQQITLSRTVALKVLPFAGVLDPKQLARFRNESRAAGCLKHPHIVPVYSVGSEQGVHYYAMQYIEGQSLAQFIAELRDDRKESITESDHGKPGVEASNDTRPLASLPTHRTENPSKYFRTIARLGIQAAEALAYSHDMGILHRDIKPSNLLVDTAGHLWITDFGLAQIEGTGDLTLTGDLIGTLRYMSPEQAAGEKALDLRTDIYSLGITLYELLTHQPAFKGTDRQKLLRQILEDRPRLPRSINPAIPKDLETIVLKATAKEPHARYGNAEELASDLRRFVEHRPIRARRSRPYEHLWHWARRNPAVAGLGAAVTLLLLVLAIGGPTVAIGEKNARREAEQHLYRADMSAAFTALIDGDVDRVENLLTRHIPRPGQVDQHGFEYYLLQGMYQRSQDVPTYQHDSKILSVALSPDGTTLAACSQKHGYVRVWDIASGKVILLPTGTHIVRSVAFSPDGSLLATGGGGNDDPTPEIKLWEWPAKKVVRTLTGHTNSVRGLAFSPDGKSLVSGSSDKTIRLWNVATGKQEKLMEGHTGKVMSVAFSPDGKQVVSGSWDKTVRVWNVDTGRSADPFEGNVYRVESVAFSSPNGKMIAAAGWDRTIRLWNVETGVPGPWIPEARGVIQAVAFLPDGKTLVAGCRDNLIRFWDVTNGRLLGRVPGHRRAVMCLTLSEDGHTLATGSVDMTVKLWNTQDILHQDHVHHHQRPDSIPTEQLWDPWCYDLTFSPDGRLLATAGRDHRVNILDARSGVLLNTLQGHGESVWSVAFSPVGKTAFTLVSVSGNFEKRNLGEIIVWQVDKDGRNYRQVRKHEEPLTRVMSVAVSRDGKLVASGGRDGKLKLWNLETLSKHATLETSMKVIQKVGFSHDGKTIAASGGSWNWRGHVEFWNVETLLPTGHISEQEGAFRSLDFSPRSQMLGLVRSDDTISLWDLEKDCEVRSFFQLAPLCVAFSTDGTRLVTGGSDRLLRIWHVESGAELGRIDCSEFPFCVEFSPDGNRLAAGDTLGRTWIWNLDKAGSVTPVKVEHGAK